MSGDVQPRKRKDKRKKKDDEEVLHHHGSIGGSDEVIHVHKENKLGGNICSKIVFFALFGALGVMVSLIIIEYHGTNDVQTQSAVDSPWSVMLEGWVDMSGGHDGHDNHEEPESEHSSHEEEEEDEHTEHDEGEYSESEQEEEVENIEMSFVKQTFDDLSAAYNQITPEESDAESTEDPKTNEEGAEDSEPEPSEGSEDSDVREEDISKEGSPFGQWQSERGHELLAEEVKEVQTESETEEESEDEVVPPIKSSGGPKSAELEETEENIHHSVNEETSQFQLNEPEIKEKYEKAEITNDGDWEIHKELDEADRDLDEGNPSTAFSKFTALLTTSPHSARALYGKARALDVLAESKSSNNLLVQAISVYMTALQAPNLPSALLLLLANRTIDRMRFKGLHTQAVDVHNTLIQAYPSNITFQIDLALTYLMINRLGEARTVLEAAHKAWPDDVLCRGYLGLTLKLQGQHDPAIPHLTASVVSDDPQTVISQFYFHLGDALQRKKQNAKAMEIYKIGVGKGIFPSVYQRSLYNVNRLTAQPWWTLEETTYNSFFRKLENNWKVIKDEGLSAYKERQGYLDEAESLRDVGDWKQYELFARGHKYQKNCKKTPITCELIDEMVAAKSCRRGQVKFSVMEGGTHVWPHCGPTNCRLRAHLGLVVPPGTAIRVADQTRTWEEGKVIVFDDSFEHEVWHNGTSERLVLIVDVWHPELTPAERASLTAI